MNVNDSSCPLPDDALPLPEWLQAWRQRIDHELAAALPSADTRPPVLHEAMRYACLNPGKRLRAILTLSTAALFGAPPLRALRPALALEIFHASTLVHDDLPCMDDDDLRRGLPATHIRYGEANALLAGCALLTLAFDWMAATPVPPPHPPNALVAELARAGGSLGVIGGQVEDLASENQPPDESQLLFIHTEKTARLISCACRCGAIVGGACAARVEQMGAFGLHLGLAFQMLDDILDATQSTEVLGKPAKSDEENHKLTAVSLWGLERAQQEAARHTQAALDILEHIDHPSERLRDLTLWMLQRVT